MHREKRLCSRWHVCVLAFVFAATAAPATSSAAGATASPPANISWTPLPPTLTFGLSPVGFPSVMSGLAKWFEEVAQIPHAGVYGPALWRDSLVTAGKVPQLATVIATEAAKLKLQPVVVLGWHRDGQPPTPVLSSPGNSVNNWTNAETKKLFQQTAVAYAAQFKPDVLFLGSETDWYAVANPVDYKNWVGVFQATRAAVKAASPATRVGTCFQYERISGTGKLTGFTTPAWQALTEHDLSKVDIIGLTSYPMFASKQSSGVTDTYLEPLTTRLPPGTPIAVLESGWPAECGLRTGCPWEAGPLHQLTYLLRPLYMEYLYVEFVCKCIYVYFTYMLDGAGMHEPRMSLRLNALPMATQFW